MGIQFNIIIYFTLSFENIIWFCFYRVYGRESQMKKEDSKYLEICKVKLRKMFFLFRVIRKGNVLKVFDYEIEIVLEFLVKNEDFCVRDDGWF